MFEAFTIGPFIIWTRVIFLLIGISLAADFFIRLAGRANLSLQHMREHGKIYIIAFILGARITAIISKYRVYLRDPMRIFVMWDGEFSLLGGAIGVALILYWATRTQRATFLQWLDVLLPASTFGFAFDWIGMFLSGHSYGKPTNLFWGVTYDAINVRYTVPVHPVQLYYALFFLLLTFLLLVVRRYAKRAGSETLFGILCAGFATFFLEYFRGDFSIPVFATHLDFAVLTALFISLGFFAVIELRLSRIAMLSYETVLVVLFAAYLVLRVTLSLPTFELRFSQFLAILSMLVTVVYVLLHRRQYPHL